MGLEIGSLLTIGSIAASTIGGAATIFGAQSSAAAQQRALENQRQLAKNQAAEQKSDRMRKANAELGTLRALELGSEANRGRMTSELSYVAGVDVGRIQNSLASSENAISAKEQSVENQAAWSTATGALGIAGGALAGYQKSLADTALFNAQLSIASNQNSLLSGFGNGFSEYGGLGIY